MCICMNNLCRHWNRKMQIILNFLIFSLTAFPVKKSVSPSLQQGQVDCWPLPCPPVDCEFTLVPEGECCPRCVTDPCQADTIRNDITKICTDEHNISRFSGSSWIKHGTECTLCQCKVRRRPHQQPRNSKLQSTLFSDRQDTQKMVWKLRTSSASTKKKEYPVVQTLHCRGYLCIFNTSWLYLLHIVVIMSWGVDVL